MRSLICGITIAFASLLTAVAPASIHAQTSVASEVGDALADARSHYKAAVDLAFEEFASGNFAEARARFLEALAIMPNARVLRALGMVEYELRNYARALDYLEQALQSQERPLPGVERAETEQLSERARAYLARYTLNIKPTGAHAALDGVPIAVTAGRSIWIEVGDHVLDVDAKGYRAVRRKLHVESARDHEVNLALQPLTAAAPKSAPPAALAPAVHNQDARPLHTSPWFWVGTLGVAVGAAIVVASIAGSGPPFEVRAPVTTPQTPPGAVIQLLRAP